MGLGFNGSYRLGYVTLGQALFYLLDREIVQIRERERDFRISFIFTIYVYSKSKQLFTYFQCHTYFFVLPKSHQFHYNIDI